MPEGDTVFRTSRRLHTALSGTTLVTGELRHPALAHLTLSGWQVAEVAPVGKHVFMRFANGYSLHNHLRMDGAWHVYRPRSRWRIPGHHARVVLTTQDLVVVGFRVHDLQILATTREGDLVGHLGPDLLADQWGPDLEQQALELLAASQDRSLGSALLDQRVMAGLGAIYVTEVCFVLGRSPLTPVGQLGRRELADAVATARRLLWENRTRADRCTTGDHRRGRRYWAYRRGGQPCRRCASAIQPITLDAGTAERTAWVCPHCQE